MLMAKIMWIKILSIRILKNTITRHKQRENLPLFTVKYLQINYET